MKIESELSDFVGMEFKYTSTHQKVAHKMQFKRQQ